MPNIQFKRTVYSIQSFLEVEVATWGNLLKEHHMECMQEEASSSQRKAWFNCFNILRNELSLLQIPKAVADKIYIVFEYFLPREGGRRPDVLILSGNNLLVLEFKGYSEESKAHIDQVKHYARDLRSYHEKSHKLNVVPFLVLASAKDTANDIDGIQVLSGDKLHELFIDFVKDEFKNIKEWFESEYAPLPSLIKASQLLFKENQFQQIKRAHSARIPITLKKLEQITKKSINENSHHLALITGVPGAGKTLVGLQFVFETFKQNNIQKAIFLSGNGPLVEVLQFSLGNNNFVKSVPSFLEQYFQGIQTPTEDVIIFDEAQRAWDTERVRNGHGRRTNAQPTDFINIGNKKSHCFLIGLIGEGQEINKGEESGMPLWTEAIKQSDKKWIIHCPEKLKSFFPDSQIEVVKEFNLTTSLRTHQALTLQSWVENLLNDNIAAAKQIVENLFKEDYPIYVTRDLKIAKTHVHNKYNNEPNKTFGLIASSKDSILPDYGIENGFNRNPPFTDSQYYVDNKHSSYCRNMNNVVTEFSCQGLELDMPILAWGNDWTYLDGWRDVFPNNRVRDSFKLRKNSYRVLLTRGRDGLIIFVPNNILLHSTYEVLLNAGCHKL